MDVKEENNVFINNSKLHDGHMLFDLFDLYSILYIAIIVISIFLVILLLIKILCCNPFSLATYFLKRKKEKKQ